MTSTSAGSAPRAHVSAVEKAAGVVLFLESAALIVGGGVTAYYAVTGEVDRADSASFVALFAILVGGGVGLTARGFLRGARWSRGAAIVWQALQASVAFQLIGPNNLVATALLVPVAVVVAGAVVATRREAAAERAAQSADAEDEAEAA